jgi:hypothetical protein
MAKTTTKEAVNNIRRALPFRFIRKFLSFSKLAFAFDRSPLTSWITVELEARLA